MSWWEFRGFGEFCKGLGLTFLYQSYEIGAYSLGRPELTIPTKDLQGIVRPEILKESGHYKGAE